MHRSLWASRELILGTPIVAITTVRVDMVQVRKPSDVRSAVPYRYLGWSGKFSASPPTVRTGKLYVKTSPGIQAPSVATWARLGQLPTAPGSGLRTNTLARHPVKTCDGLRTLNICTKGPDNGCMGGMVVQAILEALPASAARPRANGPSCTGMGWACISGAAYCAVEMP